MRNAMQVLSPPKELKHLPPETSSAAARMGKQIKSSDHNNRNANGNHIGNATSLTHETKHDHLVSRILDKIRNRSKQRKRKISRSSTSSHQSKSKSSGQDSSESSSERSSNTKNNARGKSRSRDSRPKRSAPRNRSESSSTGSSSRYESSGRSRSCRRGGGRCPSGRWPLHPEPPLRPLLQQQQQQQLPPLAALLSKPRFRRFSRSRSPHRQGSEGARFGVLYWGAGEEGWDMEQRHMTPRICRYCNDLVDSWRGRFENAQVTLRMCAAEGGGFKRYVQHFMMLSAKATFGLHLPSFYRWCVTQKRKVLTERVVLGTLLEAHQGTLPNGSNSGLRVGRTRGSWEHALRELAGQ
ncbi:unnamed protein product [Polarella glacialis]|uniref:Uncharacterized protein n=1 Tax=Polarella glacialis TaxID=89957 RepID=A0A813LAN4_POLGL|nr:unnamed protein product [Polarella glacialis]